MCACLLRARAEGSRRLHPPPQRRRCFQIRGAWPPWPDKDQQSTGHAKANFSTPTQRAASGLRPIGPQTPSTLKACQPTELLATKSRCFSWSKESPERQRMPSDAKALRFQLLAATRPKPSKRSRRFSKLRFHSQLFSPEAACAEKMPNAGPSALVHRGHCLEHLHGYHHENGCCRCRRGSPAPHVWRLAPKLF